MPRIAQPANETRSVRAPLDEGWAGVEMGREAAVKDHILHSLDQQERLLIILWYAERMTAAEIGGVLDMSAQRVHRLLAQIIMKLRDAVRLA